jgi:hypothetical protein
VVTAPPYWWGQGSGLPRVVVDTARTQVSRGQNRGKHSCSSDVTECDVSGGTGGPKNTKELKDHAKDTEIYPGLGYQGPTSSSLRIFVFKSTQIGGYNRE